VRLTCTFLYMCSGYYDYDRGYTPESPGVEQFAGQIVHLQHWPIDLDYAGKRVVVIGSGASAVTLVPAMAEQAAHVTMLHALERAHGTKGNRATTRAGQGTIALMRRGWQTADFSFLTLPAAPAFGS
jgi:cation diffusion facilitator CzcD-associated flavoprotein CzcO